LEELVATFDRARPRHHRQRSVSDDRVEDPDDGVLGMELARGQLEGPADRGHRLDSAEAGQPADELGLAGSDLADYGDHGPLGADVVIRREPLTEDGALDAKDLGLARGPGHDDEHPRASSLVKQ